VKTTVGFNGLPIVTQGSRDKSKRGHLPRFPALTATDGNWHCLFAQTLAKNTAIFHVNLCSTQLKSFNTSIIGVPRITLGSMPLF
jgi:hypothetical protein